MYQAQLYALSPAQAVSAEAARKTTPTRPAPPLHFVMVGDAAGSVHQPLAFERVEEALGALQGNPAVDVVDPDLVGNLDAIGQRPPVAWLHLGPEQGQLVESLHQPGGLDVAGDGYQRPVGEHLLEACRRRLHRLDRCLWKMLLRLFLANRAEPER